MRAGGTCEHCGAGGTLNVHHLKYAHIYNEIGFQHELIVLCQRCHVVIEQVIGERGHSRKGKAIHLRNYTHRRLRKAGIPQYNQPPTRKQQRRALRQQLKAQQRSAKG